VIFGLTLQCTLMSIRILTFAVCPALALALAACTNTQPAYYGTYPSNFAFGANHGYDAYTSAPYDPVGSYYQNFGPATPYYYEPPDSHRDCDTRPCIAYRRDAAVEQVEPEQIALPQQKEPLNPPSSISREAHPKPAHRHYQTKDHSDD